MDTWLELYDEIAATTTKMGGTVKLFRGHEDPSWSLLPTLGRIDPAKARYLHRHLGILERNFYYDFKALGGDLLDRQLDSWDILLMMQHHGVPTRLLDWTESLGIALFFALRGGSTKATLWVLDPYQLNEMTIARDEVLDIDDLSHGYDEYFLTNVHALEGALGSRVNCNTDWAIVPMIGGMASCSRRVDGGGTCVATFNVKERDSVSSWEAV